MLPSKRTSWDPHVGVVIKFIKIYSYISHPVVWHMDVIVRGLDEKLHRKFKAEAALKGISLSKALEEAMRTWLRSENSKLALDENEANNLAYESMKDQLNNKYRGKYAVFCGGNFLGATDSLEEAGALARRSGRPAGKALVAKIGEKRPAGGEWLWSSLELQTA